jgi:hypothetical protein
MALDVSELIELYEYNRIVRQNYLDTFQKTISWEDMVKNHETAWLTLKDTCFIQFGVKIHGSIIPFRD